ncbi:hypothetical protein NDU88_003861 [Pleurodeles waltl]|uniref:Uncharacterized protein n=1 Tax=Pleurodeles waltl TaxID=8319 RepID=A0AAV7TPP0_PLEWA|nr:hypothetical protein NDU88_003861 [Pleurodeles waltl]
MPGASAVQDVRWLRQEFGLYRPDPSVYQPADSFAEDAAQLGLATLLVALPPQLLFPNLLQGNVRVLLQPQIKPRQEA